VPCFFLVYLCVQDTFVTIEWPCNYRSHRIHHNGIAIIDPFLSVKQLLAFGKIIRQVTEMRSGGRADHPTARFFDGMAHG